LGILLIPEVSGRLRCGSGGLKSLENGEEQRAGGGVGFGLHII
jgi:hypothetical protein